MVARGCRWIACGLALVAIVDPTVSLPARQRPGVRLVPGRVGVQPQLSEALRAAGFATLASGEAALIAARDATPPRTLPAVPLFAVDPAAGSTGVSLERVATSAQRVANQAVTVTATVHARGMHGRRSEIRLEDAGVAVATGTHQWTTDDERWQATLQYLPPAPEAMALRVRVDDRSADVLAPPVRGPIRTLVFGASISWAGTFLRRALEAEPGFAVASLQRATRTAVVRAGSAPAALTRADLAPFEVAICGNPDEIDAASAAALRWFVEESGGIAVFMPDRVPARAPGMLDDVAWTGKRLEAPVTLTGSPQLTASELATARTLPPLAAALASEPGGAAVVFAWRRGAGTVLFSGALDAWRYRDRNDSAFARFWATTILAEAAMVPPLLQVSASPSIVRPGDTVHVAARLRATEIPAGQRVVLPPAAARVSAPRAHVDTPLRLWPTPEPGTYGAAWRAPQAGEYVVSVTVGDAVAAAIVRADADAASTRDDTDTMAVAAHASGGAVFGDDASLIRALAERLPRRVVWRPTRPARSPWYATAFALLLCAEWGIRRRRGRP